jgi:hypothetical protein
MRTKIFLLAAALALVFGPSPALTQVGAPGDGGAVPARGGRSGRMDPTQVFDRLAAGKDVWMRSDVVDPGQLAMFDRTAQRLGITNGQITRQQFMAGTPGPKDQRGGTGQGGDGSMVAQQQGRRGARGAYANSSGMNGNWIPARPQQGQVWQFQPSWQSMNPTGGSWNNLAGAVPGVDSKSSGQKQIVYRGDNLPEELDWFRQLDSDHDGQVGLYEWRASARAIAEFEEMDLNGDGFITAEEALKYQARNNPTPKAGQQTNLGKGNSDPRASFGQANSGSQRNLGRSRGGVGRAANFEQGNADNQTRSIQRYGQPIGGNGGDGRGASQRGDRWTRQQDGQ